MIFKMRTTKRSLNILVTSVSRENRLTNIKGKRVKILKSQMKDDISKKKKL